MLELTILMPCLNEEKTVGRCVQEAIKAINISKVRGEVLVADNGSLDSSRQVAMEAGARVVAVSRRGYGNAIRAGVKAARGRWVVTADADGSYTFKSIPIFIRELRRGYQLVHGARLLGRMQKGSMKWTHQHIGIPFFNMLVSGLFGIKVRDSQSGMRGFCRGKFIGLSLRASGMEFNVELLAAVARMNLRFVEVPVDFRRDGRKGPSHLRTFRDGLRNLRMAWQVYRTIPG